MPKDSSSVKLLPFFIVIIKSNSIIYLGAGWKHISRRFLSNPSFHCFQQNPSNFVHSDAMLYQHFRAICSEMSQSALMSRCYFCVSFGLQKAACENAKVHMTPGQSTGEALQASRTQNPQPRKISLMMTHSLHPRDLHIIRKLNYT